MVRIPVAADAVRSEDRLYLLGIKLWFVGVALSLHRLIIDKARECSHGHNHRENDLHSSILRAGNSLCCLERCEVV